MHVFFRSLVVHLFLLIDLFVGGQKKEKEAKIKMPDGLSHFSDSGKTFQGQFKIADLDFTDENFNPMSMVADLMNTVSNMNSQRTAINNLKIPLPFGLNPLNVQLEENQGNTMELNKKEEFKKTNIRRSPSDLDVEKDETENLSAESRKALEESRIACLEEEMQLACDKALERYHQIRFGVSPMQEIRRRRLRDETEDFEGFVQNGLAKWMVPGLEARLDALIRVNQTSKRRANVRHATHSSFTKLERHQQPLHRIPSKRLKAKPRKLLLPLRIFRE